MPCTSLTNRRQFLHQSSGFALGFLGLKKLTEQPAFALSPDPSAGYGPLLPDPKGLLDLPAGFSYKVIARSGEKLDDDLLLPGAPDGMATFPGEDGRIILICNHELTPAISKAGPFGKGNVLLDKVPADKIYDNGNGKFPNLGGTSTHIYNPATGTTERKFMSLLGTDRNCAGGPTPWGSWLTCEEVDRNSVMMGDGKRAHMHEKKHGYVFEVPASANGPVDPKPIKAMGRFRHEAVAIDPSTGIVYQTEDLSDGLLYRYLPNERTNLHAGGKLQALVLPDVPQGDTRNWKKNRIPVGKRLPVEWIDMQDIDNPEDDLRVRGNNQGAAIFARGEGMWWGNDAVYFACTSGGDKGQGQIWRLLPSAGGDVLELFAEPNDGTLLQNGDNLTVAPWGDLFLCEDHTINVDRNQTLVGVTPQGDFYAMGHNAYNNSELAGSVFSPDGKTLFVNIQFPGITLAITGPWEKKPSMTST